MKLKIYTKTDNLTRYALIIILLGALIFSISFFLKNAILNGILFLLLSLFCAGTVYKMWERHKSGKLEERIIECEKFEILKDKREPTPKEIQTAKDIKENLEDFEVDSNEEKIKIGDAKYTQRW